MGQTSLNSLPYPEAADPADVSTDMRELAEAIDPLLGQDAVPILSTLPASPADGQEVFYVASATQHVLWRLRYRADIPDAYKWQFIGGAPQYGENEASATVTATTYADPATGGAGAYLTCPLAGFYDFHAGALVSPNPVAGHAIIMALKHRTVPATDGYAVGQAMTPASSRMESQVAGPRRLEILTAGQVVSEQFRLTAAGTGYVYYRRIMAFPVRVKA